MEAARFRQIYQNEANQGGLRTGGHTYGGCEGGRTPKGMKCHCKTDPKTGVVSGSYKPKKPKANRTQYSDGLLTWNGYVAEVYHMNKPSNPDLRLQDIMADPSVKEGWDQYKQDNGIYTQKELKALGMLPSPSNASGPKPKPRAVKRQGQGKLKLR